MILAMATMCLISLASTWWALVAAADEHDAAAVVAAGVSTANAAIGLDGSLSFLHIVQRCRMRAASFQSR